MGERSLHTREVAGSKPAAPIVTKAQTVEARDDDLLRTALDLGADPALRDRRFGGTPLEWARHFGNDAAVALLTR